MPERLSPSAEEPKKQESSHVFFRADLPGGIILELRRGSLDLAKNGIVLKINDLVYYYEENGKPLTKAAKAKLTETTANLMRIAGRITRYFQNKKWRIEKPEEIPHHELIELVDWTTNPSDLPPAPPSQELPNHFRSKI